MSPIEDEDEANKIVIDLTLTETEQVSRIQAIEDIEGDNFHQQNFKSSRSEKAAKDNTEDKNENGFSFGTQAELSSKAGKIPVFNDDSLFSQHLFGNTEEREEKYLKRIFTLRQKALVGEPL